MLDTEALNKKIRPPERTRVTGTRLHEHAPNAEIHSERVAGQTETFSWVCLHARPRRMLVSKNFKGECVESGSQRSNGLRRIVRHQSAQGRRLLREMREQDERDRELLTLCLKGGALALSRTMGDQVKSNFRGYAFLMCPIKRAAGRERELYFAHSPLIDSCP